MKGKWRKNWTFWILTKKKNKKIKKGRFKDADEKIIDCLDPRKTRVVVEFNDRESASIKSFAVKK